MSSRKPHLSWFKAVMKIFSLERHTSETCYIIYGQSLMQFPFTTSTFDSLLTPKSQYIHFITVVKHIETKMCSILKHYEFLLLNKQIDVWTKRETFISVLYFGFKNPGLLFICSCTIGSMKSLHKSTRNRTQQFPEILHPQFHASFT